jgi:uncharacterized membrane protein
MESNIVGWLHLIASIVSLIFGVHVLATTKGDAPHRFSGKIYVAAMILTNLTSLLIFRQGKFWFPHWLALAALLCIFAGLVAVKWKRPNRLWLRLHLSLMVLSYYLLIGGAINEAFQRVPALKALAPSFNSPIISMTHFVSQMFFVALLLYFFRKYKSRISLRPESHH